MSEAVPARGILRGVWLLARGDARGLDAFEGTRAALVRSLVPWLALAVTGALLSIGDGEAGARVVTDFAVSLAVGLLPLIATYEAAVALGRGALWPRYATALNWCNWAVMGALLLALAVGGALEGAGVPTGAVVLLTLLPAGGFGLWLRVTLVRHGLSLGLGRAVGMVAAIEVATAVVVVVHVYLGGAAAD